MYKILFTTVFLSIFSNAIAQEGLGYYYDFNNHLIVFDKGNTIEVESNPVDSIRVGDDYIAYIDQRSDLRVYYNGNVETIEESVPNAIIGCAKTLVYKMQHRLMIYEHGERKELSEWAINYFAGDLIVTWQEANSLNVMAYQNGEIKTVESGYSLSALKNGKTGKNVFAYTDMNNEFKVFYNDEVFDSQTTNIRNYKCGLNTVAYIDRFNNSFNVFYNGAFTAISEHIPKSYLVGDDMVSYIDYADNFFLFYGGKTFPLETYVPTYQNMKENILLYYNDPELKIIYAGKKYNVEKFIQQPGVLLGPNSALYKDNNNKPKYFYKGKTIENFMNEQVREMYLYRDLPVFKYGTNTVGFYYNDKLYEYETSKY